HKSRLSCSLRPGRGANHGRSGYATAARDTSQPEPSLDIMPWTIPTRAADGLRLIGHDARDAAAPQAPGAGSVVHRPDVHRAPQAPGRSAESSRGDGNAAVAFRDRQEPVAD